ncbi:hypothetical protein Droror1_Dr00020830 [Drosera rotundifolia]
MDSTLKSAESTNVNYVRRITEVAPFAETETKKAKEAVHLLGEEQERVNSVIKLKAEGKRPGKVVAVAESSENPKLKKAKHELRQKKAIELLEATIAEARVMIKEGRRTKNKEIYRSSPDFSDSSCNYSRCCGLGKTLASSRHLSPLFFADSGAAKERSVAATLCLSIHGDSQHGRRHSCADPVPPGKGEPLPLVFFLLSRSSATKEKGQPPPCPTDPCTPVVDRSQPIRVIATQKGSRRRHRAIPSRGQ